MEFVVSDFQDLLPLRRSHPEWRDELRPLILGEDVMRTTALIQETNEILKVVGVRLDALTKKVEALAERQLLTAEKIDLLIPRVDRLIVNMGRHERTDLEIRYALHLGPSFARWLRQPNVISAYELDEVDAAELAGTLSPEELQRLRSLDLMVVGSEKDAHPARQLILAAEFSATIARHDVERAHQAAGLLQRIGLNAVGFVGGYGISERTRVEAEETGVIVDLRREPE